MRVDFISVRWGHKTINLLDRRRNFDGLHNLLGIAMKPRKLVKKIRPRRRKKRRNEMDDDETSIIGPGNDRGDKK